MKIIFDPAKNARNIELRGLSFELIHAFDFARAWFSVDARHDYGEIRYRALGLLDERVCAVVFVEAPNGIRVISFRKANKREVKLYEQKTKP
jgi:uncharacterized protein